jgi:hypothetical protein
MAGHKWTRAVAALAAVAVGLGGAAAPTGAAEEEAVTVIASGLNGPFGISAYYENIFVAENSTGQVLRVNPESGATDVVLSGLPGPSGVARTRNGLAVATAGADVPDAGLSGDASVFFDFGGIGGEPTLVADLEAYELEHNPDGQLQFDPETGEPLDALSNPFAMTAAPDGSNVLVADGGGNDVLLVTPHRQVTTFFVPPTVDTGGCEGVPNNDPEHTGCDSVPTGVAYGPDGNVYVSTLQSDVPGEGRVYILDPGNGDILDVIEGLNAPTGVAVGEDGNVYVSEVFYGAPAGEEPPPPDFDPSSIGRIVRIPPDGDRSYAAVTMPTGLLWFKGTLYSSAWSTAGFLGIEDAGQIVAVHPNAFS